MTLFEILNKMHKDDTENGTANLWVCPHFVEANKTKQWWVVWMWVPWEWVIDIMNEKTIPILLMINKEEYEKIKDS